MWAVGPFGCQNVRVVKIHATFHLGVGVEKQMAPIEFDHSEPAVVPQLEIERSDLQGVHHRVVAPECSCLRRGHWRHPRSNGNSGMSLAV